MGFFSKIFGATREHKEPQKVRAQYKDSKYFNKELERINLWISDDDEDFQRYEEKNGRLENHHFIEACNIRLQKLQVDYAKGEPIDQLIPTLDAAIDFLLKADPQEFKNNSLFIKCCSLLFLVDRLQEHTAAVHRFINAWENSPIESSFKPVRLIYFLTGLDNKGISTNDYKPFVVLQKIIDLPVREAGAALVQYLEEWYSLHNEEAWYDSHLREWGYTGYWSWEAAAIAKKMELDSSRFKDNPYFPYDIFLSK